ncbi:MAG TPA: FxsA family protein [Firmicutes bacterium]|nr:FxsA family protein [Bacillota bacterium]HOQ24138.1 FxsA family protein [Bacillota bacterium]HPT66443.1 FxsA family protein [Bacillota bacterium]
MGWFLLLILLPFAELWLLLEAGRVIGVWSTIFLVVATGLAGLILARAQGFMVLQRIGQELAKGQVPAGELLEGCGVLLGGLFLLLPGFITDFLGLLLLTFPVRRLLINLLQRRLARWVRRGTVQVIKIRQIGPEEEEDDIFP